MNRNCEKGEHIDCDGTQPAIGYSELVGSLHLQLSRGHPMSFCRGDGRCEICDPPTRQDPDETEDNE